VARSFLQMIGRADGDDIVQSGHAAGTAQLVRWSFREMTPNAFLWRGEISADTRPQAGRVNHRVHCTTVGALSI